MTENFIRQGPPLGKSLLRQTARNATPIGCHICVEGNPDASRAFK